MPVTQSYAGPTSPWFKLALSCRAGKSGPELAAVAHTTPNLDAGAAKRLLREAEDLHSDKAQREWPCVLEVGDLPV